MANPQLIVLVGVFLVSILLSFLFVTTEGFAPKGKKKNVKKAAKKGKTGKVAKKGKTGKVAKKGKTGKAAKKGKTGKVAKAAKKVAKKVAKMAGVSADGGVTGVPAGRGGMKFSELIQSLIAYSPGRGAGGAPYGTALGVPAAAGVGAAAGVAAAGGAELVNEVRKAVRDEVKQTRDGANTAIAARSTTPMTAGSPSVASPGLNQGAALRNPAVSPYGMGQANAGPVSVVIYPGDFGAQPVPTNTQPMVPTTNVYGLA